MSLLMQALKKAEHAKQNQEQAADNAPQDKPVQPELSESLALSPMEPPVRAEPVIADAPPQPEPDLAIPDIVVPEPPRPTAHDASPIEARPPMKPAAQESAAPPPEETAAKPAATPPKPAASSPKPAPTIEPKVPAARKTAQAVFASKQGRRGRLALRIAAVGGVAVIAGGIGFAYFYLQSVGQKSSVLVGNVSPSTPSPSTAAIPHASQAAAEAPAASAVLVGSSTQAEAVSGRHASQEPSPQKETKAAPSAVAAAENQTKAITPKSTAQSGPAGAPGIQIRQTNLANHVNPTLSSAYQAFMAGDAATAQRQYQQVLQHDAANRDALLGLAAIALIHKQPAQAGSYYVKLLELDPTDPDAIAALTSLQNGTLEQNESRLKKILAQNPQAGAIHFVLGNLYAQHARWAEAQQSYFQAYGTAPANADYAFNLAVSLDRLSQNRLALEYYQRALTLAQTAPGNFSKNTVQSRIRELQASADS